MTRILAWLRGEPVAGISGAVGAVLEVLVAFHLRLSDAQQAAVMGSIPLLLALITRQTVTPTATVADLPAAELAAQAPILPPWPVVKAELASALADRLAAREQAHAPTRPKAHRGS